MEPRELNKALSPFKGICSSIDKVNAMGIGAVKIDALGVDAAKASALGNVRLVSTGWVGGGAVGVPPVASVPWQPLASGAPAWRAEKSHSYRWFPTGNEGWVTPKLSWSVKRVVRPELSQSQRDWLVRGIRSWAYETETNPTWETTSPRPRQVYSNLGHFLVRRFVSSQRRVGWMGGGGRMETLWDWFDYLHGTALPRLASGLDPNALSRELLAVLAVPRGWTVAVRFRVVLEALIPRTLQQLAVVILPNAPSPRLRQRFPGGTAV